MVAVLSIALVAGASSADGEAFGQLEAWGTVGTAPGQFNDPLSCAVFGVDPVDGSIYSGDSAPGKAGYCRIQKLSPKGAFQGSTTIQVESGGVVAHPLRGIAVDHARERFYLVEDTSSFVGSDVLAYSTKPNASQELTAVGAPLPLPVGSDALKNPEGLAVDPADGDIVIIGLNSAGEHVVILRINNSGAVQARFDEAGTDLHKAGRLARSVAVGNEGKTYTLTGGSSKEGKKFTRAWELPEDLSELKEVPGFAEAAEGEAWTRGLLTEPESVSAGGTQIAVSPDGKTLYFKENEATSTAEEPGGVLVRAYSLSAKKTTFIYGGGEYDKGKGACAIGTSGAPLGATGTKVVVFDHAHLAVEGEETDYGPPRVVTFGPGGTGCVPAAHFAIGPAGEHAKGSEVIFDAEESDLAGNSLVGYEWDFGDGTTETVEGIGGEPASATTTHRYLTPGEYTVELKLDLASPEANPLPDEAKVLVAPSSPVPLFEARPTYNPAPGAAIEFDASASFDPAGGSCDQLTGCAPSFEMQSYKWDFGDGTKVGPSPLPTASHAFTNPSPSPLERTVTLSIETNDGVVGSTVEVITVKGTPEEGGGGGEEGGTVQPPVVNPPQPPPPPPPPVAKGPSDPQKRAQARKKCKKLKGKARAKCMKNANAIGKKKSRSSG